MRAQSRVGAENSNVAQQFVAKEGEKELTTLCPFGAGIAAILDAPDPYCPPDAPCCGNEPVVRGSAAWLFVGARAM